MATWMAAACLRALVPLANAQVVPQGADAWDRIPVRDGVAPSCAIVVTPKPQTRPLRATATS